LLILIPEFPHIRVSIANLAVTANERKAEVASESQKAPLRALTGHRELRISTSNTGYTGYLGSFAVTPGYLHDRLPYNRPDGMKKESKLLLSEPRSTSHRLE